MNGVPSMTERRPGRAGYSPSRGVTVPLEAPVAIASGEPSSRWTKTFADPRPGAAIAERLTFHGTIIETGATSFRLAHFRQQHTAG